MKVFDEGLFHKHAERTPPELHNFKGSNWHPRSSCIIAEEPHGCVVKDDAIHVAPGRADNVLHIFKVKDGRLAIHLPLNTGVRTISCHEGMAWLKIFERYRLSGD